MHRVAWGVAGVATTLLLAGCSSNETMDRIGRQRWGAERFDCRQK